MSIVYCLIAKNDRILSQYGSQVCSREQIQDILSLGDCPTKCYSFSIYYLFYESYDGLKTVCVAPKDMKQVNITCVQFTTDIRNRFTETYGQGYQTYDTTDFSRIIQQRMAFYNDPKNNIINRIEVKVETAKEQALHNLELAVDRLEDIEGLRIRTTDLENTGVRYKKEATKVRSHMYWENKKQMICLISVVLFIILVIAGVIGLIFWKA
eukprot:TRINITY_DN18762_c0_g1_i1.p1 TRINITY_DN18762_c0_g1~~TRINITY_DN18762_c0_g1_i1.p1  ORF type:complete len:217 (+),score=15.91 TRINITY_DN18762_c0_g1_i1:24-653(+)